MGRARAPHGSDFRVGRICRNRYVIHFGRWSRAWKRYQGDWGRPPRLHLPCPMPPSAVAAGPMKNNLARFRFLVVQRSATADRGLGQGKCRRGGLAQPRRSPLQAPDRPCKCTTWRVGRIGASPTPPCGNEKQCARERQGGMCCITKTSRFRATGSGIFLIK